MNTLETAMYTPADIFSLIVFFACIAGMVWCIVLLRRISAERKALKACIIVDPKDCPHCQEKKDQS